MEFCQHINLAFVHIRCPREERFNPLNLRVSTGLNFCLARWAPSKSSAALSCATSRSSRARSPSPTLCWCAPTF